MKEEKNSAMLKFMNKESRIIVNRSNDLGKPRSRSLFETIKSTSKFADFVGRMEKSRRRLHIDFLNKITIDEYIFDIHLKQLPLANNNNLN